MPAASSFLRKYDRTRWTPTYLAAQAYADDGWRVFPVRLNDDATKTPLTKWRKGSVSERATTDADLVHVWWGVRHRRAAVAVETGAASGLFVLDVDGDEGRTSLARLESENEPLPRTLVATTPRGGIHYVFAYAGGKTGAGQLGDGLDTRGDGGMFVAPPSSRPDGAAYAWVDADVLPAPAPPWLLALAAAGSADAAPTQDGGVRRVLVPVAEYVETAFADDLAAVRVAEEGTRNHQLNIAALNAGRRIAGDCQDEDNARSRLAAAGEAAGLSAGEIAATINSGITAGKTRPLVVEYAGGDDADPDQDVSKELRRLRARYEASRLFAQEQYASRAVVLPRMTLKEALAAERPTEPPLRVRDLHRVGYNTTISAAYKTGKTTLGGNLIRALADGGHFLDRFAVNPPSGRIGLLNYELTDVDMLDWLEAQGIGSVDRVAVLNLRGVPFTLSVEQHTAELVAWCRDMDVEVLHLDPHRRAFAGFGSENSNDDVNRFTDALDVLKREAGVADLFLYVHMGRMSGEMGAEHARGATALDDWADQRWVLTKNDQQDRFLYADGRLPYLPEFKLDYDADSRRLSAGEGNRRDAGLEKNKAAVLVGLEAAGTTGALVGELEKKLGITKKGALTAALRVLVADGLIVQRPAPNNAKRQWLPQFAPAEGV